MKNDGGLGVGGALLWKRGEITYWKITIRMIMNIFYLGRFTMALNKQTEVLKSDRIKTF